MTSTEMTSTETVLPTETLGVVAHAADDLRIEHTPLRQPGPDDAVVEIAYGGICGSDLHYWTHGAAGESILKAPMLLGHEVVGTVIKSAADGTGPTTGTRVAVHPATPGGDRPRYPADRPNLSPRCTYLGSAAHFPHTEGCIHQVRGPAVPNAPPAAGRTVPSHGRRRRARRGRLARRGARR